LVRGDIPSPDDAFAGAGGEDALPAATTYFDLPMLKPPHWGWNVIAYLFLGGIMGGLGLLTLIARGDREDERRLRRTARFAAFVLSAANPALLITHLGRPERFLHMLRIVKFKSPMSLGVWGLVLYSGAAGANVIRELVEMGRLPRWTLWLAPSILTPLEALLGAFTASYTGVLLSATAIPLWGAGKRHIPAASVCSGISSACALSTLLSTIEGNHQVRYKLERLEMVGAAAELLILADFRKRGGSYVKPLFEGERGRRLRRYTLVAGIAVPITLNLIALLVKLPKPVDFVRASAASVLTLVGGYIFRESLIEAGKISSRDPLTAFRQPR
jgi:formate-dependent nitrite reductase membrane component NrfD